MELIRNLTLVVVFAPLLGGLIAGLMGKKIGRDGAHWITISLLGLATFCAFYVGKLVVLDGNSFNGVLYHWAVSGSFEFNIGFLVDRLTAVMMMIVTFVSLAIHIYSIGYMSDDAGYQRFFSYMSLFTFAMLMLVTANNFLQLFFGWEGVGVVSYLLIGFWFKKESAATGSFKAFIVNRVGDFGFILGIAAILDYFGSVDYSTVFTQASTLTGTSLAIFPGHPWMILTVICVLLFIGAMGKSAQVPLHVWLPESMEGPTPISALIHAATMVTAGVFMVARMSPLFQLSVPAMSLVTVVGATGALFLGVLAFVEFDIKRVIAYSTMSQLGYMMAADGVSAYSASIFHLMTHACFKALLFLCAGSVIIAMHHEQDLRKMGNLKKYLPVTYTCFLIGALALTAIPPFSGYYSKDAIIEAVHASTIPGSGYAYICLLLGGFVTAFYIFRALFMAFHGKERMSTDLQKHLKEHRVMLIPMIMLAIPSVILGGIIVKPMLYTFPGILGGSVTVLHEYNVLAEMASQFHGFWAYTFSAFLHAPFWFAAAGIVLSWFVVLGNAKFVESMRRRLSLANYILVNQYGFDAFNDFFLVRGTRKLSHFFFHVGDMKILDHFIVNGTGRGINRISGWIRKLQTGYLYHYVFVMMVGLLGLLAWMFIYR